MEMLLILLVLLLLLGGGFAIHVGSNILSLVITVLIVVFVIRAIKS